MDKTDNKILLELLKNSRVPVSQLAKNLRISREVVNYRISRLVKSGIIQRFITEIDIGRLGYIGAAVFINIKATRQEEFRQYLQESTFVSWVAELSGIWSFGLSIIGKTNEELDKKFQNLYQRFKEAIIDHRFTLHRRSLFFYEKYFHQMPEGSLPKKLLKHRHDDKDLQILKELSMNARVDSVALSKTIGLSAPAITARIKGLQNAGVIQRFSIFIDTSKLQLYQYSVFVINKDVDQKGTMIKFLHQHGKVSFIAEYVGDQFIEFGIVIENPYDLRGILQEIEEAFPANRVMEVSLFQKEFVSIGPPSCVFS